MDAGPELVAAADPWALSLPVLAGRHTDAVPELVERVAELRAAGARLFEVIVGTPVDAYGARLTFRFGGGDADEVVQRAGLSGHPWGVPDWIGVRTGGDGAALAHRTASACMIITQGFLANRGLFRWMDAEEYLTAVTVAFSPEPCSRTPNPADALPAVRA